MADHDAELRLLVADDHPQYRRGLARVCRLIGGFGVVAEVSDVAEALAACARVAPNLALVDDELPGGGGLALARRIRAVLPGCAVLLLSVREEAERIEKERDPAIVRCLSRLIEPADLVAALRAVLASSGHRTALAGIDEPPGDALAELAARVHIDPRSPQPEGDNAATALLAAIRDPNVTLSLSPATLRSIADNASAERLGYGLSRVADALSWRQPFDPRLVRLRLLIDRGELALGGRWSVQDDLLDSLEAVLAARAEQTIVLLGEGGSGKTTLLRRLEASTALATLRGTQGDGGATLPYFVPLREFRVGPRARPVEAREWLASRWAGQHPLQEGLAEALARGGVLLLLDGALSAGVFSEAEQRALVEGWAQVAAWASSAHPSNRVLISSRHHRATELLSTSAMRVPHAQIAPLDEAQIYSYLQRTAAEANAASWSALIPSARLDILRRPFYLALFGEQLAHTASPRIGRATLVTAFVRRALERELSRGGTSAFSPPLLAARDVRQLAGGHWSSPWDLPEAGLLLPRLTDLAYQRQLAYDAAAPGSAAGSAGQDDALGSAVLSAGEAIDVLMGEIGAAAPVFRHQFLQDYFAARRWARLPEPERVRLEWRAAAIEPNVEAVLASLPPAAELPGPAETGWEDVVLMAGEMTEDPVAFVDGLRQANLALAGRVAAQPDFRERLDADRLDALRWDLVRRCGDREADLRHRIAAGFALGELGDPRFQRRRGPFGDYLLPPFVTVPAGAYPIGDDEPIDWETLGKSGTTRDHCPRHLVLISAFQIGRLPVTNAEWALFMAGGGYEEPHWWDTANAGAWFEGKLPMQERLHVSRIWRRDFLKHPNMLEQLIADGRFESAAAVERWRSWMQLDDVAFEAAIAGTWASQRATEPAYWRDDRYNAASQPVVGVSWFEARAYCNWLTAQCGLRLRLPTEVAWEAAARGQAGRTFAWGPSHDRLRCNLLATQLLRPAPVGSFPDDNTPEGVSDLHGNVMEWTSSAIRQGTSDCHFCYPYDPEDGREDPEGPADMRRVVRGGSWRSHVSLARAAHRDKRLPDARSPDQGFRLVMSGTAAPGEAP